MLARLILAEALPFVEPHRAQRVVILALVIHHAALRRLLAYRTHRTAHRHLARCLTPDPATEVLHRRLMAFDIALHPQAPGMGRDFLVLHLLDRDVALARILALVDLTAHCHRHRRSCSA